MLCFFWHSKQRASLTCSKCTAPKQLTFYGFEVPAGHQVVLSLWESNKSFSLSVQKQFFSSVNTHSTTARKHHDRFREKRLSWTQTERKWKICIEAHVTVHSRKGSLCCGLMRSVRQNILDLTFPHGELDLHLL